VPRDFSGAGAPASNGGRGLKACPLVCSSARCPPVYLSAHVPNELKSVTGERHIGGDGDPIADNSLCRERDEGWEDTPLAQGDRCGGHSSVGNSPFSSLVNVDI